MFNLAEELIEAKCSYCRGFKFLRGGYPCPQCKGTGGDPTSTFTTGRTFPTMEDLRDTVWGSYISAYGKAPDFWLDIIARHAGAGPVRYLRNDGASTGRLPMEEHQKAYEIILASGGAQKTSHNLIDTFNDGVIHSNSPPPIPGAFRQSGWVMLIER